MRLSDFDFDLPEERIAQHPLPERHRSRMMVVEKRGGTLRDATVDRLAGELKGGDLVVLNDSRVFPARLAGKLPDGPSLEALFVRPLAGGAWIVLLRPSRKVHAGAVIAFPGAGLRGDVERPAGEGEWVVRFPPGTPVGEILEERGAVPLPPYIRRDPTDEDRRRYQTIYANESGSVAAPTAGLHFTDPLFESLHRRGIAVAMITLHVGPGTFRPVRRERIDDHAMEEESYWIPEKAARAVRETRGRGGRVVAVGTTVVRALESAAAPGGVVRAAAGSTDLFIRPPWEPKVVGGMLTNFHLPRSTLFLLVSAFAGRETMRRAYGAAIDRGYRFYSYGDCMLIL